MKFYALICARAGSKGIKNKNIKKFKGKPLIVYPIKLAKSIKKIQTVSVSTDSKKIAKISRLYGADIPFMRTKKLLHSKVGAIDLHYERSLDLDTEFDLKLANLLNK